MRRFWAEPLTSFSEFFDLPLQPGLGIGPVGLRGGARDAKHLSGFRQRQAGEVAEFHQTGFAGGGGFETGEDFVQREHVQSVRWAGDGRLILFQRLLPATSPMANAAFAAGLLYQNSAHGLRCGGEKMTTVVPLLLLGAFTSLAGH